MGMNKKEITIEMTEMCYQFAMNIFPDEGKINNLWRSL